MQCSAGLTRSGAVTAHLLKLLDLALEDFALAILRSLRARLGRPHALRGGVARFARHRALHLCQTLISPQLLFRKSHTALIWPCPIQYVVCLRLCHMLSGHQTPASSWPR